MKLLFFDLETTGTNPGKHGIHQISGQIVIDGIVKESLISMCSQTPRQSLRMKRWRLQVSPVNKSPNTHRWQQCMPNLSQCSASMWTSSTKRTSSFWSGTIMPPLITSSCVAFSCRMPTNTLVRGFGQILWM